MAAAVLAGYVLSLATVMSAVPATPRDARLAHWLLAHHLDYGLGGYGTGNALTLYAGGQVHVLVVEFRQGRCYPLEWEAQASDYDARRHDATFMLQAAPVGHHLPGLRDRPTTSTTSVRPECLSGTRTC